MPSGSESQPPVPKRRMGTCAAITLVLVGVCAVCLVIGTVSQLVQTAGEPSRGPDRPAPASPSPSPSPPPSPAEALRAAIGKELTGSIRDVARIVEVSVSDGGLITVKWAINDSLTANLIRSGMRRDVHTILEQVRASNIDYTFVRIIGTFSMKDVYGNAGESEVVKLTYRRATIDKINFAGVDRKDLIMLADMERWIHQEFR